MSLDLSMPLVEMSPNVQEAAEVGRKRSHDEYAADDGSVLKQNGPARPTTTSLDDTPQPDSAKDSPADGTATAPASTAANPSSNPPPAASDQPSAKRKRLTAAEKAAKAEDDARRKKEREDSRLQKLAEKERAEAERQASRAAKQAEKAKRDEAEQEAKAAKAARQQEREERRRKKEEEEKKAREEKERKERSQLRLQSFFKLPTTPKTAPAATAPDSEGGASRPAAGGAAAGPDAAAGREWTEYDKMFQPFFVKEHVRVARSHPWLDEEAMAAKARILDEYVGGERGTCVGVVPFRPLEALQLAAAPRRTGRVHPPVREVMEELLREEGGSTGSGSGSSSQPATAAREKLRSIPLKLICFKQDVRPPYYGTVTSVARTPGLLAVARRPTERVLDLQYDYDSEAEWQDDEPGDDLDDLDDEEEDLEDEDDMDGFLDDEDDAGVARKVFVNNMEPESTGVCFEGVGAGHEALRELRMEVILASIDPFATHYWSPPPKKAPRMAAPLPPPPPQPLAPPPNNAFEALASGGGGGAPQPPPPPQPAAAAAVPRPEMLPDFRDAVLANRKLSKLAIVEVLGLQFGGLSKAETRAMLEFVAERKAGRGKVWELREGV